MIGYQLPYAKLKCCIIIYAQLENLKRFVIDKRRLAYEYELFFKKN